jgi:hypothetical protein
MRVHEDSHDPPTLHRGTSPAVHATRSVAPGFSTDGREHSTARTHTAVSPSPVGSDGAGQPVLTSDTEATVLDGAVVRRRACRRRRERVVRAPTQSRSTRSNHIYHRW